MTELTQTVSPYLPISLLQKYKFKMSDYLGKVKCTGVIFRGDTDKKYQLTHHTGLESC